MHKLRFLACAIALGISFSPACKKAADPAAPAAAESRLPSGESILDKYYEATGGVEAYKKINNTVAKGTFEAMGIKGSFTNYGAEPNLSLLEIEIPGLGKMLDGCDGKIVWGYSAIQGPSIKRGKAAEEALFNANFHEWDWRGRYTGAETQGIETTEGEACYKVALTSKTGKSSTRYYSVATGLLVRTDSTEESEMGSVSSVVLNKNYRMVDGVLAPFQIIQSAAGQTITMTMTEIKNNVDIPASVFEPPAEVKALIKE
jgi:outer membrane lipoprotein-sorting protein